MSCSIALSNQTLVPLMNTAPLLLETVSNPANRSPVLAASVRTASSCASPRTLIPSARTRFSFGHVVEVFCTQNDTNGGSNDTGTNVLAASPSRAPSTSAAMAITPDGKWPKASRSDDGVRLSGGFTGLHSHQEIWYSRPYSPDEKPCAAAT